MNRFLTILSLALLGAGAVAAAEPALPPLPMQRSPVSYFRELLGTNDAGRVAALEARSPESRASLAAKLKEYGSLPVTERELRLTLTELRWYLMPLLRSSGNREEYLATVPANFRPLLEDRLRHWDKLTPAEQQSFLENEGSIQKVTTVMRLTPAGLRSERSRLPVPQREKLEQDVARWRSLPVAQQQLLTNSFARFFQLNENERVTALAQLSADERGRMERSLLSFQKLPPEERAQCLSSFEKFARLSREERDRFLANADHWASMSESDRQEWRALVRSVRVDTQMPPMPPGLLALPELPPVPVSSGVVTNTY